MTPSGSRVEENVHKTFMKIQIDFDSDKESIFLGKLYIKSHELGGEFNDRRKTFLNPNEYLHHFSFLIP